MSEAGEHEGPHATVDDDDDVYYDIGERLKLEREAGNMGV